MSEESIQLSDELITNVVSLIVHHDERVEQDMMLGLQYLAAVSGYIVASYPGPDEERDALLEHLAGFCKHVADDRASKLEQPSSQAEPVNEPAKGKSLETDDPAMGIWKPE